MPIIASSTMKWINYGEIEGPSFGSVVTTMVSSWSQNALRNAKIVQ